MIEFLIIFSGICLFILWYIFSGYLWLLRLLTHICSARETRPKKLDTVSILLTVYNEERDIIERLNNLMGQNYPDDLLEVIVASDGSTDATNELVEAFGDPRVRLFISERGQGKTSTQNNAIKLINGNVVIFTDAGSRFDSDFVRKIVAGFSDDSIGAVDGHLLFISQAKNQIAQSQGYYWRYELALREAESRLGILAVASGACLAVRRSLIKKMDPSFGEDCIVPLDVVTQGYRVVHASDAIAYDVMENDHKREFASRVRMTLRNWQGTWSRAELLHIFAHPGYAFALWSHKLLRWLSPFFLLCLTFCLFIGTIIDNTTMQVGFCLMVGFYFLALLGWWSEKWHLQIPLVATVYSFIIANTGFLIGILKALFRQKIYKYRN